MRSSLPDSPLPSCLSSPPALAPPRPLPTPPAPDSPAGQTRSPPHRHRRSRPLLQNPRAADLGAGRPHDAHQAHSQRVRSQRGRRRRPFRRHTTGRSRPRRASQVRRPGPPGGAESAPRTAPTPKSAPRTSARPRPIWPRPRWSCRKGPSFQRNRPPQGRGQTRHRPQARGEPQEIQRLPRQGRRRRAAHPRTAARPPEGDARARANPTWRSWKSTPLSPAWWPTRISTATIPWATPRKAISSTAASRSSASSIPPKCWSAAPSASPMAPPWSPARRPPSTLDAYPGPGASRPLRIRQPGGLVGPRQPHQVLHRRLQTRQDRSPPDARSLRGRGGRSSRRSRSRERRCRPPAPAESRRHRSPAASSDRARPDSASGAASCSSCSVARRRLRRRLPLPPVAARRHPPVRARPPGRFPRHHPLPRRSQSRAAPSRSTRPLCPTCASPGWPRPATPSSRARPSSASIPPAPSSNSCRRRPHLRQAQATLDQALAQAKITAEQDKSDLADANYTVETARLEASKQEIVSRIQGEESKIDLGVAQQKLKVAGGHRRSARRLRPLQDRLPHPPARSGPGRCRSHQSPHRPDGDSRRPIAGFLIFNPELLPGLDERQALQSRRQRLRRHGPRRNARPRPPSMMDAKVEEIDRGRIAAGNRTSASASIPSRSSPSPPRSARSRCSPKPATSFRPPAVSAPMPPSRNPDPRLRPGMNGGMDIIINRIPNAISIPAKALFTRAGKPIVYLADARPLPRPSRSRSRRAIPTKSPSPAFPPAPWSPWSIPRRRTQKK